MSSSPSSNKALSMIGVEMQDRKRACFYISVEQRYVNNEKSVVVCIDNCNITPEGVENTKSEYTDMDAAKKALSDIVDKAQAKLG